MESSSALSATPASEPARNEVAAADLEPKPSASESPEIPSGSGRKNGGLKDTGHLLRFSINKSTTQFKKTPHRKSASPLNWFPRKKSDSFLKRKIRHLQEVEGRSLSLDETLGNANPHYTRMTKEKIAAKEAARKAMEAHKAAMVEASWCRILRAARIQSKKAEALLEKTEKSALEAFEAARVMGVMMYDQPDNPWQSSETEPSSVIGGRSIHSVTASFETAFEVDKEVSVAVKKAFIQLANCHSSNKEEFRALLHKISENPDNETHSETVSSESESESDSKSEFGNELHGEDFSGGVSDHDPQVNQRKNRSVQNSDGRNKKNSKSFVDLVTKMLDRLKDLQEEELSSLATIVATCGLNAALREVESGKGHDVTSRNSTIPHFMDGHMSGKETATRLPSLDKFLVKRVSRLEKEVQEARNSKKTNLVPGFLQNSGASSEDGGTKYQLVHPNCDPKLSVTASDLGSILVKHVSRLEREVQEARSSNKSNLASGCVQLSRPTTNEGTAKSHSVCSNSASTSSEISVDIGSILVKHVSGFETEVQEARNSKQSNLMISGCSESTGALLSNEDAVKSHSIHPDSNITSLDTTSDLGIAEDSNIKSSSDPTLNLEETLLKHLSHIEQKVEVIPEEKSLEKECETFKVSQGVIEKSQNLELKESVALHPLVERNEKENTDIERLPLLPKKSLAKHMSRIERAKLEALKAFSSLDGTNEANEPAGLDKILVKSVHRLERGKMNEKENRDINTLPVLSKNSLTKQTSRIERAKLESLKAFSYIDGTNETIEPAGLDKIFVKSVHRLEKEKMHALEQGSDYTVQRNIRNQGNKVAASDSLDQILVKHVSRLEKEKAALGPREIFRKVKKTDQQFENFESLENILVKSRPKHERAKLAAQELDDQIKPADDRRKAREKELQEAWGGLSLGNSVRPHLSKLEQEKAAWRRAEEDEQKASKDAVN